MRLRQAIFTETKDQDWFIWSVNPEDSTVSCLPYSKTDDDSMFVWDMKHFPMSEVVNANNQ